MNAGQTQACNQDDAIGFIQLNALRVNVGRKVQRGKTRLVVSSSNA
jgi:hypothetical protein